MEASEKDDQCAGVMRQPGQDPSSHRFVPRALRFVVAAKRAGGGMAGHRSLELFEAAERFRKVRNRLHFFGGELLIASQLSSDRLRRIQGDDRNSVSPTPGKNAPVGRRSFPPLAVEGRAPGKFVPGDRFFQVLICRGLLRHINHFHADGQGLPPPMQRADDSLLKLVVSWFVVFFGDVDDARPL
jgi:hypothetical protein